MLVPEADWNAIQETLHLVSIPGMRETDPGERLDGLKRQHRVSEDDPHQQLEHDGGQLLGRQPAD